MSIVFPFSVWLLENVHTARSVGEIGIIFEQHNESMSLGRRWRGGTKGKICHMAARCCCRCEGMEAPSAWRSRLSGRRSQLFALFVLKWLRERGPKMAKLHYFQTSFRILRDIIHVVQEMRKSISKGKLLYVKSLSTLRESFHIDLHDCLFE
jgi:hypothetical protein